MPVGAIIGGAVIAGGATVAASSSASKASGRASAAQTAASANAVTAQTQSNDKAIAEQQRQFNETRALLQPYVDAGSPALKEQMNILGLFGTDAQRAAITSQEQSPFFQSLVARGEDAILQNASATGGLRGGNTQAALSQFRPELLNQFINQQYGRLGGIAQVGQNAAAGVGNLGQATAGNIGTLLTSSGQAQANGILGAGQAQAGGILGAAQADQALFSGLGQIGGAFGGLAQQGVFGSMGGGGFNPAAVTTPMLPNFAIPGVGAAGGAGAYGPIIPTGF